MGPSKKSSFPNMDPFSQISPYIDRHKSYAAFSQTKKNQTVVVREVKKTPQKFSKKKTNKRQACCPLPILMGVKLAPSTCLRHTYKYRSMCRDFLQSSHHLFNCAFFPPLLPFLSVEYILHVSSSLRRCEGVFHAHPCRWFRYFQRDFLNPQKGPVMNDRRSI